MTDEVQNPVKTAPGSPTDSFKRLLMSKEAGLRLALVGPLFSLGLTFLFSPKLFESFSAFKVIASIPEWPFGYALILLAGWLAFSSNGFSRRWALGVCGVWWLFWTIVNELGAGVFTPGMSTFVVLWMLSSLELYRESAKPKKVEP